MSKQSILELYINAIKLLHDNEIILVIDNTPELRVQYVSSGFLAKYNMNVSNIVVGESFKNYILNLTDNNLKDILHNIYHADNRIQHMEYLVSAPDVFLDMEMFSITKKTLLHPKSDIEIGYASFITSINIEQKVSLLYNMLGVINGDSPTAKSVDKIDGESINLTIREQEILFLLCLKLSGREIADIMTSKTKSPIGASTVGNIVRERLFPKFNVHNIEALINKAVSLGYWNMPKNYCKYKMMSIER